MTREEYTREEMGRALLAFARQDRFKDYVKNAPSDNCRDYIALQFCRSIYIMDEEGEGIKKYRKELKQKLDLNDWMHLFKYAPQNPFMRVCYDNIKRLGGEKAAEEALAWNKKRFHRE